MENILEDYGPDVEYIKDDKNIEPGSLSRWPTNGNQETAQESTYKK